MYARHNDLKETSFPDGAKYYVQSVVVQSFRMMILHKENKLYKNVGNFFYKIDLKI